MPTNFSDLNTDDRFMNSMIGKYAIEKRGADTMPNGQFYLDETEDVANSEDFGDSFFGKRFQLPESIGFSDEGVIVLYNTYELASYSQGITEFTIPYEEANSFLKFGLSF